MKICFFFPYKKVSGVPVLFYRLANKLANKDKTNKIYIIDYIDGVMAMNVIDAPNLILIPFEDGKRIKPPEDSVLIMQSILPYAMRPELYINEGTRILFWNLHPNNLLPNVIPFLGLTHLLHSHFRIYAILSRILVASDISKLNKFIDTAISKNGLWFMDQSNLSKTCKYLFREEREVEFLPIPLLGSTQLKISSKRISEQLNFTWVGRLCDFKSHILIYTIKKLSVLTLRKNINIKFTIIGDGPFKTRISKLKLDSNRFQLEQLDSINPSDLDQYLLANTDVLTAMGTSALEGAKLGIPTILLDMSYYPILGDYRFRWLFDTKNFDLGHDITRLDMEKDNLTLDYMIDELLENYNNLSIASLRYFQLNHQIDSVVIKLIDNVKRSELVYSDIDPKILKKSCVRKCYETIKYSNI